MPEKTKLDTPAHVYKPTPATLDDLKFEHGAFGERFKGTVAQGAAAAYALNNDQKLKPRVMLEVIVFGKIHLVTPEEFVDEAGKYHKMLRNEALILYDDIRDNKTIYTEWADPDGIIEGLVADSVSGFTSAKDAVRSWFTEVKRAPKPDPTAFDALIARVKQTSGKIERAASSLQYSAIREIGLDLSLVREDSRRLYKKVELFRNNAIESAETITKGLEVAESASFQVLALVPTITMMDPLREAAYRIGLVMTRAGARAVGGAIAYQTVNAAVREVLGVLKADVPPLIVDLVTGVVGRYMKSIGARVLDREIVVFIVQQQIEFFCDLVLLLMDKGSKIDQDDVTRLGMNRLTSCVAFFLSKVFGGKPDDPAKKRWAKALVESTLNTLWRDINTARETAKAQQREFWDVFVSELPWTLVRIVQGCVVGVMMRNAATMQDDVERLHDEQIPGREGQTEVPPGKDLLTTQKASTIFGARVEVPKKPYTPAKQPLPPLQDHEYSYYYQRLGVHPDIAGPLRRYVHDAEVFVAFRIPNPRIGVFQSTTSMLPKPLWLKAKSSNTGSLAGLVVKPRRSPPTHRDFEKAWMTWEGNALDLRKNGAMIREDGVVFHPDMLAYWAHRHPEDLSTAQRVYNLLSEAQADGIHDFSDPASSAWLSSKHPADATSVIEFLGRAHLGYYPDLDLAEVVSATSGERLRTGTGAETGKTELAYLESNRANLDTEINVNHDLANIPKEFLGPDGKPLVASADAKPHHLSLVQHGGDNEYYGEPFGGPLGVFGPGGKFWRIDPTDPNNPRTVYEQYEALLQRELGPKYLPKGARASVIQRPPHDDPTNGANASGKGEKPRTNSIFRMQFYYERARRDVEGRSTPVPPTDIEASLYHRGLESDASAFASFEPGARLRRSARERGVYAGVDAGRSNIVLAVAGDRSIGEALGHLAAVVAESGAASTGVHLWYEIYSSWNPVTSDHILDRIGGDSPGADRIAEPARNLVSACKPASGKRLYAFCVAGFEATYSPVVRAPQSDRLFTSERDLADRFLSEVCLTPGQYKVEGLQLMDVWEDRKSRRLTRTATTLSGRPVCVFTAGLATSMPSVRLDSYRQYARLMMGAFERPPVA